MSDTRWWLYVNDVAGDVQFKDIADRVGIDKSNVTRWSKGSRPAVEFVLKFARAYGQPVVAALAEAEYITDSEANMREVKVGVGDLTELELARELLARLEREEPTSSVRPNAPVTPLRPVNVSSDEENDRQQDKVAAKKRNTIKDKGSDEGF